MANATPKRNPTQRKWALLGFVLLFLYVLARPALVQRLNISLPGFDDDRAVVESTDDPREGPSSASRPAEEELGELVAGLSASQEATSEEAAQTAAPPGTVPAEAVTDPAGTRGKSAEPGQSDEAAPALGKLRRVGEKIYESTAGLRYGSGGAEGHRLLHVMKHAGDDMEKPIHGVFEGTKDEILATIDEAWQLVKAKSSQVDTEREGDRTVYTIDMGRKIGFTGGAVGKRRHQPACRKLRIVVEGVDVITAFPTER